MGSIHPMMRVMRAMREPQAGAEILGGSRKAAKVVVELENRFGHSVPNPLARGPEVASARKGR